MERAYAMSRVPTSRGVFHMVARANVNGDVGQMPTDLPPELQTLSAPARPDAMDAVSIPSLVNGKRVEARRPEPLTSQVPKGVHHFSYND